jgi:hypothetical protein
MEVLMGKSSINGTFSMAMLNNQRVIILNPSPKQDGIGFHDFNVGLHPDLARTLDISGSSVWSKRLHIPVNVAKCQKYDKRR